MEETSTPHRLQKQRNPLLHRCEQSYKHISLRITLLAVLTLPLTACASFFYEPIRGQVTEEGTNKPHAGVIVTARWLETKSMIVDSQTVCAHVETAITDEQGSYQMPRYKGQKPTGIDSHKAGHGRSPEYYKRKVYETHDDLLRPYTGTTGERLEKLLRFRGLECGGRRHYVKVLRPLYKAIYEEAKSIAESKEHKQQASHLLRELEAIELGGDKAWENWRIRERDFR